MSLWKRFHSTPTIAAAVLVVASAGSASALTLATFTDPHPPMCCGTIGFAYVGDGFVGSVQTNGAGTVLYSTDLNGGNVQVFAPTVNIPGGSPSDEHFVSSSLGLGGFPNRDVYVAAANNIIHITHNGASGSPFLTSDLASAVRGITFDSIGTFGNDMLVTTIGGQVYRVNSAGTPTLLASVGEDTEGLDVAPLGVFGPHAGQLFVASEGSGRIRAIDTAGNVTVINPNNPVPGAEELTFVPLNLGASGNPVEGFYGANYTQNVIKGAASEFNGMQGDIVVTGEFDHNVNRVQWNNGNPLFSILGQFPNQPEDGLFVTATVIQPRPTVPEPSSWLLLGSGLAGLAAWRRRAAKKA